ncbi:reverse transcriptase domain-containing protein [Enterobacter cloacae subsp. cloacae]|uniref:reverse transcriptase domain-containing protein n=1 Tax=Enterobacter cloacae TaxID=550 RepID=UPI002184366A|nr:reverse transcriptase domain-containing protein [Enterobacter cloacae]EMC0024932.1 hypothetical protein [Enterobacter cloacae]MCT2764213.1 hypothetical protein [Enterobacter cloacae]MCU6311911.1 hypothetical protein [Enterobacter cloacae]WLD32501.1 reverse transcriptase domain-containing protein [Enterobacter cloacae subsp. cloacae]HDC4527584.1 hypothetical protein [Enterobacter cloacae]
MHKFKLSPHILELFSQYKFFSPLHGMQRLSSEDVFESRLGKKIIYNPRPDSYGTFRKICDALYTDYLLQIPCNMSAVAYIEGKSYFNFIEPHRNNFFFLRLDIKNFFPSISYGLVKNYFKDYFSEESISEVIKQTHLDAFVNFVTLTIADSSINDSFKKTSILPMGFPLSPIISNIIFRRTDILIEKICVQSDITYTRYADDLLFSSRGRIASRLALFHNDGLINTPYIHTDHFYDMIKRILKLDSFKINRAKIIKSKKMLSLNGYTIIGSNDSDIKGEIRVSNKKTKKIEKLIHELAKKETDQTVFSKCYRDEIPVPKYSSKKEKFLSAFFKDQIDNKLSGYRAYLLSMIKFNDKYDCFDFQALSKYKKIITDIEVLLSKRK